MIMPSNASNYSGKTSPGTKILFKDNVEYSDGLLLLSNKNVEVLGGNVDKMIEKWKMEKMINNSVGKIPKTKAPQWKPFLNTVKVVNAPKNDGNKLVNDTNNAKQRQIFTSDSKSSVSKNERKCLVSKNETKPAVSKNDAKLVGSKNNAKSLVSKNNVKLLVSKNEIKPIQNDSKAFISKNGTKALVNKNNNDSDHFAKSNINQNTLNPPKSTTSLSQASY
uniref:RMI1_N domain-containing protein n=1 Tax=Rhabditophanes sp. KR3021 TaxID=114890 RepID=A0AC35UHM7_9BILA